VKRFLQTLVFIPLGITLFFWFRGSGTLITSLEIPLVVLAIGRLMGLTGVLLILLQLLLIGRIKWIERLWGHDKLAHVHHKNGRYLVVCLILHFVLILVSHAMLGKINIGLQFERFLLDYDDVALAFIALVLFIVIAITSIYISKLKLKYETWYFVHLLTYVAILLAYGHQLKVGGDFYQKTFALFWISMYVFVSLNFVWYRFLRSTLFFLKHGFTIDRVVAESGDVTSIYITGRNLESFTREGGQFVILRFLDKKRFWQAHPFSLSQSKSHNTLRVSVKNSGDFTSEISKLVPGTKVFIDGPHGVFTMLSSTRTKLLCIAGGIGITPIRSLIEESDTRFDSILLYSNGKVSDIVFRKELEDLSKTRKLQIHHFITDQEPPPAWANTGRINSVAVQKLVPDISEREIFLCGPVVFMNAMKEILSELGVDKKYIHFEKFSLH